ncbi:hypothetical protein LV89_00393 [Arcicella aurantiaca]|uniref:Uncharacterized protein n=1 Tax=Arcicella aurantiaca TaxID=591202 RepID=A0A316EDX4_9BACT|nr:hypothetical protein [Arcicella aurantiaca]PWK28840.1 hypothetical protein LV89_00393 [Arcicella aurantiaca]
MNNSIQIHNQIFEIDYHPATVVQSDKYEESSFITNNSWSHTPKHDLAFRLKNTDQEFFFTTEYSAIRAYVGQEVHLITLNKKIIGFLNTKSNDYYYLTNKFARILGFGVSWKWILLIEILLGIALFSTKEYSPRSTIILALFIVPAIYWILMRIYNLYLEKKIDKVVSNG